MFELETENSPIRFTYEGKEYAMTADEIKAAYWYQDRQYRLEDAERQLKYLCFGDEVSDEEINALNRSAEIAEDLASFEDDYGMSYCEALKHLGAFVLNFEIGADCNLDENSQWENAIKNALKDLAEQM